MISTCEYYHNTYEYCHNTCEYWAGEYTLGLQLYTKQCFIFFKHFTLAKEYLTRCVLITSIFFLLKKKFVFHEFLRARFRIFERRLCVFQGAGFDALKTLWIWESRVSVLCMNLRGVSRHLLLAICYQNLLAYCCWWCYLEKKNHKRQFFLPCV